MEAQRIIDTMALDNTQIIAYSSRVNGIVQGVGFRPFVWQLAKKYNLDGEVANDGGGVLIHIQGKQQNCFAFFDDLSNAPPLARIDQFEYHITEPHKKYHNFVISESHTDQIRTSITPDAATCDNCLQDIIAPDSRRYRYALTNCTHCGPRFSIVNRIPYDRKNTSMHQFKQCEACLIEYTSPSDRRFHAQPNACYDCGPEVELKRLDNKVICYESLSQLDAIDATTTLIQNGDVVAIKGIGGFHLACDATNEDAVAKLRAFKVRGDKPLAMMARDREVIARYTTATEFEKKLLESPEAPIVLLKIKEQPSGIKKSFGKQYGFRATDIKPIAANVAPSLNRLGFMLPYSGLHHLLLKRMNRPIVLTSANIHNKPQVITESELNAHFSGLIEYSLTHNRDITNRVDDSIVQEFKGKLQLLRRSRGYSPAPIKLPKGFEKSSQILALGAELKSTFCLVKDGQAILSQHMGDLESADNLQDFIHNISLYKNIFNIDPNLLVVDKHPEYLSSKYAEQATENKSLELLKVQHHHAHIASCMADNDWPIDGGNILGVALDGLGLGSDNTFWGGEFIITDYHTAERVGSFKAVEMLGGSQAIKEPWRNTYAHLRSENSWSSLLMNFSELELIKFLQTKPLSTLDAMLKNEVNSPTASSVGRLFDAVAAAIGLCREFASYEGQAAIELEAIINHDTLNNEDPKLAYPFSIPLANGLPYIEPLAMWHALLGDLILKTPASIISARFHKGLTAVIIRMIEKLTTQEDVRTINTVALTGGVFQNRTLLECVYNGLVEKNYSVLIHHKVPCNDGGIAYGQAVIVAATLIQEQRNQLCV